MHRADVTRQPIPDVTIPHMEYRAAGDNVQRPTLLGQGLKGHKRVLQHVDDGLGLGVLRSVLLLLLADIIHNHVDVHGNRGS